MLKIIFLILIMMSLPIYALEITPLKDNETAKLTISSKALNRIFVRGDRIVETYGIDGSFKIEKDEEQGDIYIIPMAHKTQSFTLFVKTENRHNFTLHLTPADIESNTIGIKPLSRTETRAKSWELSAPYENVLIDLINNMSLDQPPRGYASIPFDDNGPQQNRHHPLTFQLKSIYRGHHLDGQIWSVTNTGDKDIPLSPKNFRNHVLAASFDKRTLKKNESAKLYWVKSNA